jgi:hypothetical protein
MIAVSFAAGLNVYATVATLGLLGHTRWLVLPASLHLLADWRVIAAALALFAVDFFADKIPGFDVAWNALHTFIRVPVAALMAFQAASNLSPGQQLVATLAGGMIAFIAHGGDAGCGDAIARAVLEYCAQPGRGCAGGIPDVAFNVEAVRGRRNCRGAADDRAAAGALDVAHDAVTVLETRRGG